MEHPAELAVHQYMESAVKGNSTMSEDTINQVASDIKEALTKQFNSKKSRDNFTLRMSNVGRPACQLWYDKNKPEVAIAPPTTFLMNMMIGDIVEAVFKGILKEAGVKYKNSDSVKLELDGTTINGTYDIVIDDAVDDIKSASDWSYKYKFESFDTLKQGDSFGYVSQLAGYAKASGLKAGGWWVVNKATGAFKYIRAKWLDIEEEIYLIQSRVKQLKENKFVRKFQPVTEMYRKKSTGNMILNSGCKFCAYRFDCWPTLQEIPSLVSQAKDPKIVQYVEIEEKYKNA